MTIHLDTQKLRQYRERKKLTQEQLAELAGISDRYERDMELGRCRNPSLAVLYPLSRALHISMEELVYLEEDVKE